MLSDKTRNADALHALFHELRQPDGRMCQGPCIRLVIMSRLPGRRARALPAGNLKRTFMSFCCGNQPGEPLPCSFEPLTALARRKRARFCYVVQ